MNNYENKLYELISQWLKQKETAIPDSSYYYYCYGIVNGLKQALTEYKK